MAAAEWAWRRWIGFGFFALFILIGVAAVLGVLLRATIGGSGFPGMNWAWGLLGFLFFLWLLMWVGRAVAGPWYWWRPGGWSWSGRPGRWSWYANRDEAAEILRVRYARGEITKEQFEAMMRDLEAHRPGGSPPANV